MLEAKLLGFIDSVPRTVNNTDTMFKDDRQIFHADRFVSKGTENNTFEFFLFFFDAFE